MYKLEVYLKQHTPYIQFSDEEDAGLRATDVKPRLDKYLLEFDKYFRLEDEYEKELFNKVKNTIEDSKASLYKMKITFDKNKKKKLQEKEENSSFDKSKTLYFGAIENFEFYENLKVVCESFDYYLLEMIAEMIPIMFAYENFGARQNKGFGSFTVEKLILDEEYHYLENVVKEFYKEKNYLNFSDSIEELLYKIKNFYQEIKTGGKNNKSTLKEYFEEKGNALKTEKDLIKKYLANNNVEINKDEFAFYRVLLGMPNCYVLKKKTGGNKDKKEIFNVSANSENIDRIPSPLFFKPIKIKENQYKVFIWLKAEGYKDILNVPFKFTHKISEEENKEIAQINTISDFDFQDFFKFIVKKKRLENNSSQKKNKKRQ